MPPRVVPPSSGEKQQTKLKVCKNITRRASIHKYMMIKDCNYFAIEGEVNTICYDEQPRRSMKREATARRYGLKVEAADSSRSLLRLEPFAIQFAKYFSFCTHLQRAQLLLGWCT